MLPQTYFPIHNDNRMLGEGDVAAARERYLKNRPSNLRFLLSHRYSWMNAYLVGKKEIYELGAGAGFAREFIANPQLRLTDVSGEPWIDLKVDAMNPPFRAGSVDVFICSHMIHHLASPHRFFEQAERCLADGGYILISEINTSWLMRFLLRLMRHEGWSYEVDVFDPRAIANDPQDPWSANCAIPELLFESATKFEAAFPRFKVIKNELTECLIFPLSGGVIARTRTLPLPLWALQIVERLDRLLIRLAPRVFALGRNVVLQKKNP